METFFSKIEWRKNHQLPNFYENLKVLRLKKTCNAFWILKIFRDKNSCPPKKYLHLIDSSLYFSSFFEINEALQIALKLLKFSAGKIQTFPSPYLYLLVVALLNHDISWRFGFEVNGIPLGHLAAFPRILRVMWLVFSRFYDCLTLLS